MDLRNQNPQLRIGKVCGCLMHDHWKTDQSYHLLCTSGLKQRKAYRALIIRGLITERRKYLCIVCYEESKKNFVEEEMDVEEKVDEEGVEQMDEIEEEIDEREEEMEQEEERGTQEQEEERGTQGKQGRKKWRDLNDVEQDSYIKQAFDLGQLIFSDLFDDSVDILTTYTTDRSTPKEWLLKRNKLLTSFLSGCTGVNIQKACNSKKMLALTQATENVLYTRNLNLISPFSFSRNLLLHMLTKNKLCIQLAGVWTPAGSYTTLNNFICKPQPPLKCPPLPCDVMVDNNQKVSKTSGRICEGSKVPVEICTACSFVTVDEDMVIMKDPELKPSVWLKPVDAGTMDKIERLEEVSMDLFREVRGHFIEQKFKEVGKSNASDDYVSISIMHKGENYVCSQCCHVYPISTNLAICPKCSFNPQHHDPGHDPYDIVKESQHPQIPPVCKNIDPCLVNPNSEKNVLSVIEHVKEVCEIGSVREYVTMWSDGVPYLYASKLQERLWWCKTCKEVIDISVDEHKQHQNNLVRALDYIILRPGPGHIELNMTKTLLDYLWDPLGRDVAKALGFRTQRAQEAVHHGIDLHRNVQVLHVLLHGLALEMIRPYMSSLAEGVNPTVTDYFSWVEREVNNGLYMYYFHVCFTGLLSQKLYTAAVRKNNSSMMMAGRVAFTPLFYGRSHGKYQELMLRDLIIRVQCPKELENRFSKTEAFSPSGNPLAGQGADFCQEQNNKDTKSFLPPGVITGDTWCRVCRMVEDLKVLRDNLISISGLSLESGQRSYKRFDLEVTMVRRIIRESGHLRPFENVSLVSVGGTRLDASLGNVKEFTKMNYQQYKDAVLEKGFHSQKLNYFCITEEERSKANQIDRKDKASIVEEINVVLLTMPDRDIADYFSSKVKDITCKLKQTKKEVVIALYHDIMAALQEQLAQLPLISEDDE